jgi:hypothetical protein
MRHGYRISLAARYLVSLAAVGACRFGGPSANPDDSVSFRDAGADGVPISPSPTSGDDAASTPAGDEAAMPAGDVRSPSGDAPSGDAGGFDSAPDDVAQTGACSSTVAVCDPVHNTGCNPLQQCDVNPLQATVPTGQCVFGGGVDAGGCTASFVNESCAPKSTCVDGGCRQLCFCNADCPPGQCCSDTSGPPGFTLCRPCP